MLKNYSGSDDHVGRIYELFVEGANCAGITVDQYIETNEYVEAKYDGWMETCN